MKTIKPIVCTGLAVMLAAATPAVAGLHSAVSPAVTVDTRDIGDRPIVEEVRSPYCSSIQHVYFLNGVPLNVTFTAKINWNEKSPGTIQFITPFGGHTQPATAPSRTYDVGTDFGVCGKLKVKAVASNGTASAEHLVNFDVIPPPPGFPVALIEPDVLSGSLVYRVPHSIDWDWFDEGVNQVPKDEDGEDITWFTGNPLRFALDTIGSAQIQIDGTASVSIELASGAGLKCGPLTIEPRLTADPTWTWMPDSGRWRLGGSIHFSGDAKATLPKVPIWGPVYGKGKIEGSLDAELGILEWSEEGRPVLGGEISFEPTLTYVLGAGWSRIVAGEGEVGGGPIMTLQFPHEPTLKELGIHLHGKMRVIVLFYRKEKHIFDRRWFLVGGESASQQAFQKAFLEQMTKPDAQSWELIPRDYLNKPYALFSADKMKLKLLVSGEANAAGAASVAAIQENVFPYSEPMLAVNGAHRMLLWIWDNPERSAENRTELVWSRWQDGAWSNPTSVWNEGTADFAPSVHVFADGSAIAAWQNEAGVLPEGATLDDALAGLEIAVAQFDPITGKWSPTNLTSNAYLDRSPQLAAGANGRVLLTWIGNESNSVQGATNEVNTIHSRLWNGSAWLDVGDIATGVPMLLWSTVAFDGTNAVFVAAVDGDDDQATPEDQELWGATFSSGAWSAFTQLTTNTVQDTKPQAVFDSTGTLLLAWYQGSNIVIRAGDLNLSSPTVASTLSGSSSEQDFALVTGPAGRVSMIWEELAGDGTGPDPMLLNYDPTFGVWSQPLRLLTNTNQLERSFSGAYSTNGALLLAYNRVDVMPDTNGVPQFGQVDLMFLEYLIGEDVVVLSSDITLSTNAVPGQAVNILAVVRNTGELAVTNVQVMFYGGHPTNNVQIGSTQTVPGTLPAGSNAMVQVNWVIPNTTSNRTIYVKADLADRNAANNTGSLTILAPDLQISNITVIQPNQTNRIINARCINAGTIPSASPVEVTFRRGSTTGAVVATVPISMLPVDGMYDASFEWNMTGLTFTTAFEVVYAKVDAANLVAESDEDNNTRIVQVMTTLDSDSDGLLDGEEARYGTNPYLWDTDGDGLSDGAEVQIHKTDPTKWDTDGDGMADGWEVTHGLDPLKAGDEVLDSDGDGQTNLQEYLAGTNPRVAGDVFKIGTVTRNQAGQFVVTWQSVPGKTYKVLYADTMNGPWKEDLPNSVVEAGAGETTKSYTDSTVGTAAQRFYKVRLVQ